MMATPETGLIGVAILFVLLLLGVPIGISLGTVGLGGLALILGTEPALIKSGIILFGTLTKYELGTLPLFLLVAHLCFSANASRDFFDVAAKFFGHRRGGLAMASVAGCAGFSAINGSSLATAATMGLVAIPEMRKAGYSDALATGTVAAGGTLGPLIPPSSALIVFGIITEQSIGKLFTAAIVPAMTQMLFYLAVIAIVVRLRPSIAPATPRVPWAERWVALSRIADMLVLIGVMIGGIALGWFTPSESASIGVMGAILITARRKKFSLTMMRGALHETLKTSGFIYVILIGALIFSVFISACGLAEAVGHFITDLHTGKIVTLLMIAVLLLLLGSVLDGLGLMLLTTPILMPIVVSLGLTPIWFGVFLVRATEIGFVHPPIGMNLYVIHGIVKDVSLSRIFKGVLPFLASDLVHLLLIILFPAIVLGLPKWLGQ
jgi:C4-dicarboxylate transporter, DctM subunit